MNRYPPGGNSGSAIEDLRIVKFGPSTETTKRMGIKSGSRREMKSDRRRD